MFAWCPPVQVLHGWLLWPQSSHRSRSSPGFSGPLRRSHWEMPGTFLASHPNSTVIRSQQFGINMSKVGFSPAFDFCQFTVSIHPSFHSTAFLSILHSIISAHTWINPSSIHSSNQPVHIFILPLLTLTLSHGYTVYTVFTSVHSLLYHLSTHHWTDHLLMHLVIHFHLPWFLPQISVLPQKDTAMRRV